MTADPDPVQARWTDQQQSQYDARVRSALDRTVRERFGVRLALLLGFTSVFGLWLFSGYQLLRNLERIQDNLQRVQQSYARGEQALIKVRTNVLLGSIYLRDALIDSAAPRREYYRASLTRLRDEIDPLVVSSMQQSASPEREQWARLRDELRDYWASRELAFGETSRTAGDAYQLLRQSVVPKREGVLQIVDQLSDLQTAAHRREEMETEQLYQAVRARIIAIGGVTLVVAFAAALAASRRVSHLQRQVEQQRSAEQRIRHDLERLSARLVDIQERERRDISRELHDAVGQALTAVKMDIGIALRGDLNDRTRAALDEAKDITENTLQSVRDLSQLLHPSTLDDFGLPETLRAYLKRFSERTGIRTHLIATLPDRLPSATEACVYRIIQEAMNNVARHSEASECHVTLGAAARELRLAIEDNGRGLQSAAGVNGHGLGLIAMRERAQAQNGSFTIGPRPGGGTRIVVTIAVPVTAYDAEQEIARQAQAG
jgi:signal transduction histidine kinase